MSVSTVSPLVSDSPASETATVSPERTFLSAELLAHASESARLRDLDYVANLGSKSGRRIARKAFAARVDALRK